MRNKHIKFFLFFTLFLSLSLLCSCGSIKNKYVTMPYGVNITVPQEFSDHFLYKESIPVYHFGFDGINVLESSTADHYIFVENDFRQISDEWEKFIIDFKDDYLITKETEQLIETVEARLGSERLVIDEYADGKKQKCSMEYLMICYGKDGSRYSCSFRTFVSGGKRYYGYAYTGNLEIKFNMPLQVVKVDGENKLVLLPLPFDTKYSISNSMKLHSLIEKDTYLNINKKKEINDFYKFTYPTTFSSGKVIEHDNDNKAKMIEEMVAWYDQYCKGEYVEGLYYVEHAGARFIINFDEGDEKEFKFSVNYVGPATR